MKISIIIPNYNNGALLRECLESVLKQNYKNKEIIVVDDGSTDNSVETIKKTVDDNKDAEIKVAFQGNMNAAMARNRGIEMSTGDYLLFLDSDDILEDGALNNLVSTLRENEADLVIGGYSVVGGAKKAVRTESSIEKNAILDVRKSFEKLVNIPPVPSNKLYRTAVIKKYNLAWGNVRIGQDLNFYLKYLSKCEKAVWVDYNLYRYRIRKNSLSRTYSFRIFDIVESFNDVEKYYRKNGDALLFEKYMPALALLHYNYQMSKSVFFERRNERDLVVRFFSLNEKRLDYSKCIIDYKGIRFRFRLRCIFRLLYVSKLYSMYKTRRRG